MIVPELALASGAAGRLGGGDGLVADPGEVMPDVLHFARIDVRVNEVGLDGAGELAAGRALEVAEHVEGDGGGGAAFEVFVEVVFLLEDAVLSHRGRGGYRRAGWHGSARWRRRKGWRRHLRRRRLASE